LVASEQESTLLFDISSGGTRQELEQHQGPLVSAAFDDSGERLLTADSEGLVALWECRQGKFSLSKSWSHEGVQWCGFVSNGVRWVSGAVQSIFTGATSAGDDRVTRIETGWQGSDVRSALCPGTGRIVAGTSREVASWNLAADDPAASRIDLPRHEGYIEAIAVSHDGRRAATSMIDGPIRLWSLDSPIDPVSLPREQSSVMLLEFVDRDRMLISGQSGGSIAFWDLDIDRILERAVRAAGRELTDEERRRFLAAG
jgi:WD40 repeat protein